MENTLSYPRLCQALIILGHAVAFGDEETGEEFRDILADYNKRCGFSLNTYKLTKVLEQKVGISVQDLTHAVRGGLTQHCLEFPYHFLFLFLDKNRQRLEHMSFTIQSLIDIDGLSAKARDVLNRFFMAYMNGTIRWRDISDKKPNRGDQETTFDE